MNKKGFTLVELLAVIAILALLVIIALPNVLSMFNNAKKDMFLTEAKSLYKEVSKKYITETMRGNKITKISNDKNKLDMESNNLEYNISLDNMGNIKSFQVSDGTYCISGKFNNLGELTTDKISEGECEIYDDISPKPTKCTFDGELVQGATYVSGQYTYKYKQEVKNNNNKLSWIDISTDGWGVQLTNSDSSEPVTSTLCTYINNKPIVSMANMFLFSDASSIDVSSFNTSNVVNMQGMFDRSKATSIGLSHFNTSKVTNMESMFRSSHFNTLDLSNFDTSNVTNMSDMFSGISTSTINLSSFDTSKVTDMSGMFSLTSTPVLDLSNFDTSNVINMMEMFFSNKSTTINLSSFNTSNVTDMKFMFFESEATTLDVSKFNTSKVTNMSYMFGSSLVKSLDLSNFDTSKVTDMSGMFSYLNLDTLDLSSFDTSKVTDMEWLFIRMSKLKTIYVSNKFVITKVTNDNEMFYESTNLVGGSGTKYNSSKIGKTYAKIDGGTSSPGYFTAK